MFLSSLRFVQLAYYAFVRKWVVEYRSIGFHPSLSYTWPMNGDQVAQGYRRENEHVGHAVARAVSKGGSAEGVFAGAALAGEQVLVVGVVRSLISV